MIIKQKPRELLPEGQYPVTITEVKDLGIVDSPFGKKHQLYVVFTTQTGKSIRKYYTASTHEKSTFYKDVKAITGKAPGKEFNTDTLLNLNLGVIIQHEDGKDGVTRDKIAAFLKAAPGQATARAAARPVAAAARADDGTGITDADIAF